MLDNYSSIIADNYFRSNRNPLPMTVQAIYIIADNYFGSNRNGLQRRFLIEFAVDDVLHRCVGRDHVFHAGHERAR